MQIYCLGSVGQKFETGLAGLKSKYFMAAFLLGGYRVASVSLPFPMFGGCAQILSYGSLSSSKTEVACRVPFRLHHAETHSLTYKNL